MMKDKNQIINQQKEFISELKQKTLDFISKIDKTEIETILLSGSVARGDYFPGKYGGMTDLIIMRKPGSMISPEELLGENQDPGIPYHCVCSEGNWFEILFSDFIDIEKFQMLDEARKSAIMESTVLFDKAGKYGSQSEKIKELTREYCRKELKRNIEYIRYLISDYKKNLTNNTWLIRGISLLFLFLGLNLIIQPIVNLGSTIPILGELTQMAAFASTLIITIALGTLIISLAWLLFRPEIAIPLIIISILTIISLKKRKRVIIN